MYFAHKLKEVEADDGSAVFNPRGVHDDLLHLSARLRGALKRGGIGQLNDSIQVALVLFGQKTTGNLLAKQADTYSQDSKN